MELSECLGDQGRPGRCVAVGAEQFLRYARSEDGPLVRVQTPLQPRLVRLGVVPIVASVAVLIVLAVVVIPTVSAGALARTRPLNLGDQVDGSNRQDDLALVERRLEFEAIADAIRRTSGNITRAAELLKMKRPRLSQIVNGDPQLKSIKEESRQRR